MFSTVRMFSDQPKNLREEKAEEGQPRNVGVINGRRVRTRRMPKNGRRGTRSWQLNKRIFGNSDQKQSREPKVMKASKEANLPFEIPRVGEDLRENAANRTHEAQLDAFGIKHEVGANNGADLSICAPMEMTNGSCMENAQEENTPLSASAQNINFPPLEEVEKPGGKPQVRTTPAPSLSDTCVYLFNGSVHSEHGEGEFFADAEIIGKENIVHSLDLLSYKGSSGFPSRFGDDDVALNYTKYGKAIIQQQAVRGCTAAVTAMLLVDHKKDVNAESLRKRNLGDTDTMLQDLQMGGINGYVAWVSSIQDLRQSLIQNGSAIVHLGGEIGNHVAVVDEVSEDLSSVRIREPYHGWEITVTAEAFRKRGGGQGEIIHVKS